MKIIFFDSDTTVREVFSRELVGHECVFVDGPVTDSALQAHADAEAVSLFVSSSLTKEQMDMLPSLKLVAARSAGVDAIDAAHAKERAITLVRVPKYGQHTVAEFAFALMLALSRRLVEAAREVHEEGMCDPMLFEGFDLNGKTLGVVGTGNIGRAVVSIAQGFGMEVLMNDKFPASDLESANVRYAPFEELLARADIITLHAPYTPENHHLLGAEQFAKCKKGVVIINTARGELIDTAALVESLKSGQVGGAGLDVLEGEHNLKAEAEVVRDCDSLQDLKTMMRDHELMRMPRVIVTPHVAFFSREAYHDILQITAKNIVAFASGTPENVVA